MSDRLECGMPTGPGPPSALDPRYQSHHPPDSIEGYDVEFVPQLEQKYECPICLMALRDPMQTECGHRFCQACIFRSIRDAGPKCPIDNSPLSREKVFPDNFAKREILSLIIRCPNSGCNTTFELRNLEHHQLECEFLPIPCPNNCGLTVKRRSMEIHLQNECLKRCILCQHCHREFIYDQAQVHKSKCPELPVSCDYCGKELPRRELPQHIDSQCLHAVIPCTYSHVGCHQKMKRQELASHLHDYMEQHLKLVTYLVQDLRLQIASGNHERLESGTQPRSWHHTASPQVTAKVQPRPKPSPVSPAFRSSSEPSSAYESYEPSGAYAIDAPPRSDGYRSGDGHRSGDYALYQHTGPRSFPQESRDLPVLREKLRYQEAQTVIQEQRLRELQSKLESRDREILMLNSKLQRLESVVSNGVFFWKVECYSEIQRTTSTGETNVMHSPAFYTGYYGYKLCLRVNLNGVESNLGSYVSLFVHFMQGEWDDFLEWPFSGKITLSILDQSDDTEGRQHLSETLIAKPSLAAFQKPKSNRNHKGFGYMEFAPLSQLRNRTYIKNNCIIIKAAVYPN